MMTKSLWSTALLKSTLGALLVMAQLNLAQAKTQVAKSVNAKPVVQEALRLSKQGRLTVALQKLSASHLQKSPQADLVNLVRARLAFDLKQYAKALEFYLLIPRTSTYWLTSVEERAWARTHLGQKNEAVADSLTLMSPLFADVVSPEAYYLAAYVSHQLCDFERVFKVTEAFKTKMKPKVLEIEAKLAQKATSKDRLQLTHVSDVIRQLHLIEADAIQRIELDQSLQGKRGKTAKIQKDDRYALEFPYEEDDVWIDEVDHLKVSAKNCPVPFQQVVKR